VSLKIKLEQEISALLRLANERNTEQGKLVCVLAIDQLHQSKSETELLEILAKINHSFLGVEAHGHLTQAEYAIVMRLREMAANK
jgi:hypothetical protein